MNNRKLFPDEERDNFGWQAYVSSALTMPDEKSSIRDRIKSLNLKIKSWLQEFTDTFAYLPQEYSDPSRGDKMTPEEIYILDRWRIAESDFIIMNLDYPSFGVGQEAEIACSMGIPVIAFHYSGHSISRIIRGLPAIFAGESGIEPSEGIISYQDQDAYTDLQNSIIAKATQVQKLVKPLPKPTKLVKPFSERLDSIIKKSGKTKKQIAQETGFTESFLNSLLNHYKSIESVLEPYGLLKLCKLRSIPHDRYSNPGLWVLERLSEVLNTRISVLIGEDELDKMWHEPLRLVSRNGVTLEEFVEVSEQANYMVIYQKAAKSLDIAKSSEEVADNIINLVDVIRSGRKNKN